jgi:hypothetical protein
MFARLRCLETVRLVRVIVHVHVRVRVRVRETASGPV